MKFARIVPLAVVASFVVSAACGAKLDPVQVDGEPSTDGSSGSSGDSGASGGGGAAAGVCGTSAATIAYAAQAQAVISKSCGSSSCHGGGQRPLMTDFASSKTGFSNGGLSEVQAGSMPLGGALSVNDKCILTTWASGGYAP